MMDIDQLFVRYAATLLRMLPQHTCKLGLGISVMTCDNMK